MNNRLKNKIIVITGGNGLLGKAIISRLISEGAFCINFEINHDTNEDLSNVYCDITDTESIDTALEIVLKKYKKIDGLVNNAYPRTKDWGNKFEDIVFESWKQNVDWQLNSYFYLTQKVASKMASQKTGSIINMSSIYGVVGPDFGVYEGTTMTMPAAYSAIKGALVNFTRYVASYFGPQQVRVNAVSPGGIFDNQNEIFVNNYCKKVPMRRLGTPEDIAPTVAFLLSDDSQYITGQNLIVDGGWTAI
ncbi:NAD(P)-dependent dehydrogenase, short-chain alcohol dehydrogenase family [Flavobacterium flevense]|uniref:SDR family oxidoreductase n=1 Tax=Flavobacterium flevense TaxID=983 RepID=A0A4Y4AYA0_9FLAO|nr:oxidoreductase [Flavobacterium flevense]GEC73218.1 SDR family oxidoreductase [Flavobacterium flevense]SHL99255.1 NAD(P)-dependent dehydrogenase, short-chain alcohol dehydrogenase family [Flavobacterium flevense]